MVSVFVNLLSLALCFVFPFLYALHGQTYLFSPFALYVLIACPIFFLPILKTQILANPFSCLDLMDLKLCLKLNTSSSQNRLSLTPCIIHLSRWQQSSPKHLQWNLGISFIIFLHPIQPLTYHHPDVTA